MYLNYVKVLVLLENCHIYIYIYIYILYIYIYIYIKDQLIEQVVRNDADKDIQAILWEREKYWQSQLFTNVYGMNSVSDLYSRKRKGCRRK